MHGVIQHCGIFKTGTIWDDNVNAGASVFIIALPMAKLLASTATLKALSATENTKTGSF